jgi:hypothetical protein
MAAWVLCTAGDETQAMRIISRLKNAAFLRDDLSVLLRDRPVVRSVTSDRNPTALEPDTAGASAAGVLGAAFGWLAGRTAPVVGPGPILGAGPIVSMLGTTRPDSATNGISAALLGMGVPEHKAKHYADRVNSGRILISVHSENRDQRQRTREIFQDEGAEDLAVSPEPHVHVVAGKAGPA